MEKPKLIALPIMDDFICEQAQDALTWDVYMSDQRFVEKAWQLRLEEHQSLDEHYRLTGERASLPLEQVDVVIVRSMSSKVILQLCQRNIDVYITKQRHPERAAIAFLHGLLEKGNICCDIRKLHENSVSYLSPDLIFTTADMERPHSS